MRNNESNEIHDDQKKGTWFVIRQTREVTANWANKKKLNRRWWRRRRQTGDHKISISFLQMQSNGDTQQAVAAAARPCLGLAFSFFGYTATKATT